MVGVRVQDKGGEISRDKFVATMSRLLGGGQEKAKAMFDAFDVDGSGYGSVLPLPFQNQVIDAFRFSQFHRCARVPEPHGRCLWEQHRTKARR